MTLRRFIFSLLLSLTLAVGLLPRSSVAQDSEEPDRVAQLVGEVNRLRERLQDNRDKEDILAQLSAELLNASENLVDAGVEITPRLTEIRVRLEQLGRPPEGDTVTEPVEVSEEREALLRERSELNKSIGLLEQKSVEVKKLRDEVAEARRTLFANQLSRRSDVSGALGGEFASDVRQRMTNLWTRISAWASFTWRTKSHAVITSVVVVLALGAAFYTLVQRLFGRWIRRPIVDEIPSYFSRLTTAFWYTLLPSLALWVYLFTVALVFGVAEVLRDDILNLVVSLFVVIAAFALVFRLSDALFAPSRPKWRLFSLSDRMASRLRVIFILMALVSLFDLLIVQVNQVLGTSVSISIVRSFFTAVVIGVLLLVIAVLKPFDVETDTGIEKRPWPWYVKYPIGLMGIILIVSASAGYIGFAHFAAQKIVGTGTTLALMYLGYLAAKAIAEEGAFANSQLGTSVAKRFKLSETTVDQIGLFAGIFLGFVVLMTGLPFLALRWGADAIDIGRFLRTAFTDIKVGNLSISLTGIAVGILLFFVAYWLTRRAQRWIDGTVLERTRVEAGARNSIRTSIGYIGIAISALIGISAAGFNLSQLALVAGALSLGIGFGLQNVVSNFVSGLILLFERPFKTGDIIEAGGFTGTVKTIKVRATEIELFDRKTLILPNSELINSAVSNWMHRNTLTRLEIPVGVAYDSDPRQVEKILREIAEDHPRILSNPEPIVAFVDFGASSLDFILYAYLADVSFSVPTRSELRFAIFERFKALGIEIPFPQSDVHLNVVNTDAARAEELPKGAEPQFDVIKTSKTPLNDDD